VNIITQIQMRIGIHPAEKKESLWHSRSAKIHWSLKLICDRIQLKYFIENAEN